MITQRTLQSATCVFCTVLALVGCGGGGGGGGGGGSGTGGGPGATAPLTIQGLPVGASNAASMALRIDPGAVATAISWTLDDGSGSGPVPVATGMEVVLDLPEGSLVVSVRVRYADGGERSGQASLLVDRTPPSLRLTGIGVQGSTLGSGQVVIRGVADADGTVDDRFQVDFTCDGAGREASLAIDAGSGADYDLPIAIDGRVRAVRVIDSP